MMTTICIHSKWIFLSHIEKNSKWQQMGMWPDRASLASQPTFTGIPFEIFMFNNLSLISPEVPCWQAWLVTWHQPSIWKGQDHHSRCCVDRGPVLPT